MQTHLTIMPSRSSNAKADKPGKRSMLVRAAVLALLQVVTPALAAEGEPTLPESRAAESDGMELVIGASRTLFQANAPLELRIVSRNTTPQVIWVPPPLWNFWTLHLEDTGSGQRFTGVSTLPMGLPTPFPAPVRLQAQQSHTVVATFKSFAFLPGAATWSTARAKLFELARQLRPEAPGLARLPTPPTGVYRLTVEIRSPPDYRGAISVTLVNANLCKELATHVRMIEVDIRDDVCRVRDLPDDFDPTSLWKGEVLRSHPIEITMAASK